MKLGSIISIFFSGIILTLLGLNYITPFIYENQTEIDFYYPRNNLEILFEFFVVILVLICSIGLLYKKRILSYFYPIPILFTFYVALVFLLIEGRYGNYSVDQIKIIGFNLLAYSVLSIIIIMKKYFVEEMFFGDRKFLIGLFQFLGSVILFTTWIIIAR